MRHCLLIFLLFSAILPNAQTAEQLFPAVADTHNRFIHLASRHTLSPLTTAIVQDADGFLWLGTQHGLYRYDGYQLKIYRATANDPASLSADWISSLLVDTQGQLWIGTRYGGLNRYNTATERFERITLPVSEQQDISAAEISVLYQDPQGHIWVGTYGQGLFLWQESNQQFQATVLPHYTEGVSSRFINDIIRDAAGTIWLATGRGPLRDADEPGGLLRWQPDGNQLTAYSTTTSALRLPDITAVTTDNQNQVWLATYGHGLARINPQSGFLETPEQPALLQQSQLTDLLFDDNGTLWLTTYDNGLWQRSPAGAWQHHQYNPQLPSGLATNALTGLMFDQQQTLWLLSQSGLSGLTQFARLIKNLPQSNHPFSLLKAPDILGIDVVSFDRIWLANREAGMVLFDAIQQKILRYYPLPEPPSTLQQPTQGRAIKQDSAGRLWAGTDQGLYLLDPETGDWQLKPLPTDSGSVQPHISVILEDRQKQLWIGSRGDGVFLLASNQQLISHYHTQASMPQKQLPFAGITTIKEDHRGDIWIGSTDSGLVRLIPQQPAEHWVQHSGSNNGLQFNGIQFIYEEQQHLWVRAGNLNHRLLRNEQQQPTGFKPYISIEDYDAEFQQARQFRMSYRTFWSATDNSYLELNETHGLQSNTWIGAWAEYQGWLFRGGRSGLDYYNPSAFPESLAAAGIKLTDFSLFNQTIKAGNPALPFSISQLDNLNLQYRQDMFSLQFSALDYIQPAQRQYRYQLHGFDRDWLLSTSRTATYTRLPPGQYQFQAESRLPGGQWLAMSPLSIQVLPPWWMSWWFRLLATSSVLLILWSLLRRKILRERSLRQGLERLVAKRTAELQEKHQALQQSYQDIMLLQRIGREITSSLDLDQALLRCYQLLSEMIDTFVLIIGIYREPAQKIDFAFWMEDGHRIPEFSVSLEQQKTLAIICFNQQREIIVSQRQEFLNYMDFIPEQIRGQAMQSVLYFPLTVSDKKVGIFSVQSPAKEAYNPTQIELLRTLSSYIAIAVANADSFLQLQQTQKQLVQQEKMASLGSLVAGVAHEINTPLGICVTATSHIQAELTEVDLAYQQGTIQKTQFSRFLQQLSEGMKILQSNTERAANLVQSFKQISVDQSGNGLRELELCHYLNDVVLSLQPQLKRSACQLILNCPAELKLYTDAGAIAQIITNLVMNSLQHGLDGTSDPQIHIQVTTSGQQLQLTYRDNGRGVEPQHLPKLFEPFYTTRRNRGGTGLGTHIVYNLVTARLKGSINAYCEPGQGLQYHISFPLKLTANSG